MSPAEISFYLRRKLIFDILMVNRIYFCIKITLIAILNVFPVNNFSLDNVLIIPYIRERYFMRLKL